MADDGSKKRLKFRIGLSWSNVPRVVGPQATIDIATNFTHRPWHQNVRCEWDQENRSIILEASNDFDKDGQALIDEFSDEISACVKNAGNGDIRIVFIKKEE